ncbi:MAG: glycosyltransferase family 4 protein [Burkholderiaceae bacterium]|nr:glycosyltransferase family 4 protein [Burkholderiaceae bacterium]MCU0963718.1 glycosyltransferase family 4 protein [Burkholderiaceae bacterium]
MFKVTDYLVQYQAHVEGDAVLRPLDTRGGGHVLLSLYYLPRALLTLLWRRLTGRLAGVHVNMAERASMLRKGLVVAFARLIGAPVVIHLHAAQIHLVYRGLPAPLQAMVRWVFSLADEVLVLGQRSATFALEELRCRADRVHVVLNGVPAARLPRRLDEPGHQFRILFLGNLSERKGVTDLLRAFTLMRSPATQWQATLAGGGDVDGYRRTASDLGLGEHVIFFGWARQDQAAELLAAADVLVLPSYDEGLPLVILEALANSVAVICTPVGEIPSTLTDGRDALFVPPGDPAALAAALDRLIAEPALRRELETQGRAFYERGFSIEAFFNAVAAVHRRLFGTAARFDPAGRTRGHGA